MPAFLEDYLHARFSGCCTLHRWAGGVEELLILEVKTLQRKIFKECCFVLSSLPSIMHEKRYITVQYPAVCMRRQRRAVTHTTECDAVPWNSPSDDQLAYFIFEAIFKVLISTLHTYLGQVCMGPLHMR